MHLWNTGGTIGIAQKSGTREHQHSNRITKQHHKILPIQNNNILSTQHNRIEQNKNAILAGRIFIEMLTSQETVINLCKKMKSRLFTQV